MTRENDPPNPARFLLDVEKTLKTVRYKPGWAFSAYLSGNDTVAVVLEPPPGPNSRCTHVVGVPRPFAPLACNACEPVQIRMTRYLEPHVSHGRYMNRDGIVISAEAADRELVLYHAWALVKCLELHEAGEWFTVSGERPHDPHALTPPQQCEAS